MPLISVIVPVYNAEKTIQETIESILNQTFTDFDLIIINDGCQDSTLKVISTIQDPRLKVFSYLNSGVSASRNRGLAQATGEFISFIDADDLWTANKLENQLRVLRENIQAAVAYSWTDWIDESGQILGKGSYITQEGNVFAQMLLNDFVANGSNCLIRRQALIEVGGFDETLAHGEDWDLWLRLAARYEFIAIPSPQVLYRISSSSASCDVWNMEAGSLKIIEKAYAIAPESLQHLKKHSLGNRYKYLTFKALEGTPERRKGLASARFFYHAINNDLSLLQAKVIWKVLFRIVVITLLPPRLAQVVLAKFKPLFNTVTLLGYMKLNILEC
ncbi:glycosyltransferase [Microcoleus sp. FACHB-SPT15]|uniref:glycosyltransferase n=1 Tax=Microcoleus sp. FACHB-SPT15 TaxID=2692830 RepID=UPI00177AB7B9|nr:glycosyltransferase [Microcoleus sp. FACHB-SPT15]MBD1806884.1 glycosyltransferase [Microcoleus sp. FACHB-SPT15]